MRRSPSLTSAAPLQSTDVGVSVTPPPRELIQLLPMPRLHVMIDTVVAAFVGLHGGGSAAAGSAAARAAVAGRAADAVDDLSLIHI